MKKLIKQNDLLSRKIVKIGGNEALADLMNEMEESETEEATTNRSPGRLGEKQGSSTDR